MPNDQTDNISIIEEPNVIDDNLLDIIGNEFQFDHEKGLSEWLKNSVDAYIRSGISDSKQNVILRFTDGTRNDAKFECIDFAGMSEVDIQKAFKRWGDPEAARRGLRKRVYGGHGNGGKFYMRQMFDSSYFVTYKNGYLNIFGFNKNRRYGFADGFQNLKKKPNEALKIAGINNIPFPNNVKDAILSSRTGFTVVKGIGPTNMRNIIKLDGLLRKFKNHPQVRRILGRIKIWYIFNNSGLNLIIPEELNTLPGFEEPICIEIPPTLPLEEESKKTFVDMSNKKYEAGRFILRTSEEALGRGTRYGDLNRIDVVGEIGVIASYQLSELGVTTFPQASFIYGECECPILEDPDLDAVKNDRSKLVESNPRAKALLDWVRERVEELSYKIAEFENAAQEAERKRISLAFNEYLNRWKDKFMKKVLSEIFRSGTEGSGSLNNGKIGRGELAFPENGFSFSYPAAEILVNESEIITLKAGSPDPVPAGSIISIECNNPLIEVDDSKLVIKSEDIKTDNEGNNIAVLNFFVVGKNIGEEGKLIAKVGNLMAEMDLRVIEGASGTEKTKKPKSPTVLLSRFDSDPLGLTPVGTVVLTERDPLVYQRYQDVQNGIYWINTDSPIAKSLLDKYGDNSVRWRDYLFQRYVDIFVKEAIYELHKRDPEGFRPERIDTEILGMLVAKIHTKAVEDLENFFFDEEFEPVSQK
jgi:hypothetical protein